MLTQGCLHFGSRNVLPAPPDHVLGPAHQEIAAPLVLAHQVAGMGPPVAHPGCRRLGLPPVALRKPGAPADELTDLAPSHIATGRVHQSGGVPGLGPANRPRADGVGLLDAGGRGKTDFRGAIRFPPRDAPARLDFAMPLGWNPRAGNPAHPVSPIDRRIFRLLQEQHRHGAEAVEERAADVANRLPERGRRELRQHREFHPDQQGEDEIPAEIAVVERCHDHHDVVRGEVAQAGVVDRAGDPPAVGQHAALGKSGGAGGVLERGQRLRAEMVDRIPGRCGRDLVAKRRGRLVAPNPRGAVPAEHQLQIRASRGHDVGQRADGVHQHQRAGTRIGQEMAEIGLLVPDIDRHDHGAQPHHAQPDERIVEPVGHHDGHPVPRLDPERREPIGHPGRTGLDLRKGEPLGPESQTVAIRRQGGASPEEMANRRAVGERGHGGFRHTGRQWP